MIKKLRSIINIPAAEQVWVVERALGIAGAWEIISLHATAEGAEAARNAAQEKALLPLTFYSITSYMMKR